MAILNYSKKNVSSNIFIKYFDTKIRSSPYKRFIKIKNKYKIRQTIKLNILYNREVKLYLSFFAKTKNG